MSRAKGGKYRKRRVKLKTHDAGHDRHNKTASYELKVQRLREAHHREVSARQVVT
jgi:hypothetical protein